MNGSFQLRMACFFRFIFVVCLSIAPAHAADFNRDGRINLYDLALLQKYWSQSELSVDLIQDRSVDGLDALMFCESARLATPAANSLTVGRAAGVYAVIEMDGEEFTTPELEIKIEDGASGGWSGMRSARRSFAAIPSPQHAAPRDRQGLLTDFKQNARQLESLAPNLAALRSYLQINQDEIQFGKQNDRMGTFNGWTFWLGWAGSFSENYTPEMESFAWVIHLAPEACYVSLQHVEAVYSNVDLFAGIGAFVGVAYSPDGDEVTRQYLGDLMPVSLSFDFKVMSAGVTFFRIGSNIETALQYDFGKSVNFAWLPIPTFLTVSIATKSEITNGFYPIIKWNITDEEIGEGNPIPAVIDELESLIDESGGDFLGNGSAQFARLMLPVIKTIQGPKAANWKGKPAASSFSYYFNEFIDSRIQGGNAGGTTIDDMRQKAKKWLGDGDDAPPPTELTTAIIRALPNLIDSYQTMNTIQAGTDMGFELGYKHGYDASGRDNVIYSDEIVSVTALLGVETALTVTAQEISDLLPGSNAAQFEGSTVIFDPFNPGANPVNRTIKNGKAEVRFTPAEKRAWLIGVQVPASNLTGNKTIELARRAVTVVSQEPVEAIISGVESVPPGEAASITASMVDGNGAVAGMPNRVRFYDGLDRLLGVAFPSLNGVASFVFAPEPSTPAIRRCVVTRVGYTEEDARDGYAVLGSGFSWDADVVVNGVSLSTRDDVLWGVITSKQILFQAPDGELYTKPFDIRVINPGGAENEPFTFTP
ncbi:MAG: hypothetical protein GC154_18400 [bacterium]|nr:hypothetical protein [bacterium]